MNEELLAVTDELHHNNDHMPQEIQIRQTTEEKLRLRERQHRALLQLFTDNTAALAVQMQTMLTSALQLAQASDGHIALLINGQMRVRYAHGTHSAFIGHELTEKQQALSTTADQRSAAIPGRLSGLSSQTSRPHWQNLSTTLMVPLKLNELITGTLTITWEELKRSS